MQIGRRASLQCLLVQGVQGVQGEWLAKGGDIGEFDKRWIGYKGRSFDLLRSASSTSAVT